MTKNLTETKTPVLANRFLARNKICILRAHLIWGYKKGERIRLSYRKQRLLPFTCFPSVELYSCCSHSPRREICVILSTYEIQTLHLDLFRKAMEEMANIQKLAKQALKVFRVPSETLSKQNLDTLKAMVRFRLVGKSASTLLCVILKVSYRRHIIYIVYVSVYIYIQIFVQLLTGK